MNAILFDELGFEVSPCSPVKSMQWKNLCVDLRGSNTKNRFTSALYAVRKLHIENSNQPAARADQPKE